MNVSILSRTDGIIFYQVLLTMPIPSVFSREKPIYQVLSPQKSQNGCSYEPFQDCFVVCSRQAIENIRNFSPKR